jgi:predicted HAD superfamily Cof-like phosphohydrolase
MTFISDIDDFHKKFGFEPRKIGKKPDVSLLQFRLKFLCEELLEMQVDAQKNDLEGVLDALVDLVYVAIGTAWLLNLDFDKAWSMVHQANMKKVRADKENQGKRGSILDVVKPEGWKKPDIAACIHPKDLVLKQPEVVEENKQISIFDYLKTLEVE